MTYQGDGINRDDYIDFCLKGVYTILIMRRVNLHLTEQQILQLQALSLDTGLSVAEHVRRALDEYLSRQNASHLQLPHVSEQDPNARA